MLALCLGMEAN